MTPSNDDTAVLRVPPAPADDDLNHEDGLATELAKAAPRQWWNKVTIGLLGGVLLVGGFVGGLEVQKNYGTSATAAGRAGGAGGAAGRGNFGGYGGTNGGGFPGGGQNSGGGAAPGAAAPGASAAAAGPTTGKIKLVDGTTIYVETSDGSVVTVRTSGDTKVQTASTGKLKDFKAGDPVSVQGSADADGTVTATTVTKSK
ncbi:DUF5666 domain-containing protein [Winogradskya humida]|uniref:DUF5666 domain-containing protein n=1 Tax=Winogradskya humida TaxID=113566 RepID=A0ABQ3ZZG5_9ACTN|nr:DUF5666 domain-containing protein [Actinoplanes humidus]GIE23982.1 hypothetical protein Ahu01nite_070840 [Actinoplanes humidus]